MPIPPFDDSGVLPHGMHECEMPELIEIFGYTTHRKSLISGLQKAFKVIRKDLPHPIYLDGSFVTKIIKPADIDVVIDMIQASDDEKTIAFRLMLSNRGKWLKNWRVDFMPELPGNPERFIETFQKVGTKSGVKLGLLPDHQKGILLLKL